MLLKLLTSHTNHATSHSRFATMVWRLMVVPLDELAAALVLRALPMQRKSLRHSL